MTIKQASAIVSLSLFCLVAALAGSPALAQNSQTGPQGGFAATGSQGGFAGAGPQGGFDGPGPVVISVSEARSLSDDAPVTLEGSIVRSLGKDKYEFQDSTGSITVEIDDDKWQGQRVGPQDTVILYGEVDKDLMQMEIDVKSLRKK
jgi:uncharacterized protein (TIGR00156 family)